VLLLGLSFAPMIGRALAAGRRAFVIAAAFAAGASAAYFGWHIVFELIAPEINAGVEASPTKWSIVVGGLVVLYVAQSLLQTRPNGWFSRWLQPHLVSGLYIDDWFTRVTFRLWPPGFR
jgi:NAD(P)H-quinone oxidoreductase subunit 5